MWLLILGFVLGSLWELLPLALGAIQKEQQGSRQEAVESSCSWTGDWFIPEEIYDVGVPSQVATSC